MGQMGLSDLSTPLSARAINSPLPVDPGDPSCFLSSNMGTELSSESQ